MDDQLAGHRGKPDGSLAAGVEGRRLNVTQLVLEDGQVLRARKAQEHLLAVCSRLSDEMLAARAFGENYAASVKASIYGKKKSYRGLFWLD